MRLTKAGIGFINDNLSSLIGQFGGDLLKGGVFVQEIPSTETALGPIKAKVCPDGSDPTGTPHRCVVEADIKSSTDPANQNRLKITPAAPNLLKLSGNLKTKAELINIKVPLGSFPIVGEVAPPIQVSIGDGQNGDCSSSNFTDVPLTVDIAILADTNQAHGSRAGLSRVKITQFDLAIPEDDVHICGKCDIPIACNIWDGIIGGVGGLAKGLLIDQLKAPLQDQIDSALCIKGNPNVSPPCPVGSSPKDPNDPASTCVFDDGSGDCASFALGTEGTIDLGGALSAFSPTTSGGLDFLFGVGGLTPNPANNNQPLGDLAPVNEGATLSLSGGANANPLSKCVNPAVLQKPTGIPTPQLLLNNDVPGWPADSAPHFGLAISEAFTNYALGGIYNSGLLCLQIGTEQVAQLSSSTLGALIPSFKLLPMQKQNSPVGLVLRPTAPPVATFGTGASEQDPTMLINLNGLGIDFYVWSSDRYIRAFSSSFDLGVPVNLGVTKEGLTPQIANLAIKNMKITNSELLAEKPEKIGAGLEGILSGAVGQALGGLQPIDLSSALGSLGFTLNIPPSEPGKGSPGIQKLTEGSHNFLGIFAGLGVASATPSQQVSSKTSGAVTDRKVSPEGLRILTMTRENAPVLKVTTSVETAAQEVGKRREFTYRVNKGYWRPWTSESELVVRDDILRLQGKHTIQIKSRVVGEPLTETDVAAVPVTLDVDAPRIRLTREGSNYALKAVDDVADDAELRVRYAIDQNGFGDWQPYHDGIRFPVDKGAKLTVEVKDGEENIATTSQALRGKIDTTGGASSGGCGCTVPGQSSDPAPWTPAAIGLASVLAFLRGRRRRLREAAAGLTVVAIAGTWSGCSCSEESNTDNTGNPTAGAGGEAGSGGSAGKPNPCKAEDGCVTLDPGLVGSYTSAAAASDGTLWVAGYNEADYSQGYPYGDLVVGTFDATKNAVDWKTVDGINPDEEVDPTTYNAEGWRGGRIETGDDVGLWTSIAIGEGDKPMVAYYDVTNGALKFASFDGEKWAIHTIQQKTKAQIGRYAKMHIISGKPVIAFMFYEPAAGGGAVSGVRVARAKSATPAAGGDWTFEEVFSNPGTPCRASFCDGSNKCNLSTGKCEAVASSGCTGCASDEACFTGANGPACQPVSANNRPEAYLNASGLYVAAAPNATKSEIGIAFYDRLRGNLYLARKDSAWSAKIVDGQSGENPGTDTGDVGIGASLSIDDKGDWHLAYVNGLDETLRYLLVPGGIVTDTKLESEVIDFGGAPTANEPSADKSIVGDDSNIRVEGGKVTVSYQNASSGKLRFASRTGPGAWTRTEVKQDGKFAGFFSQQVSAGKKQLVNFWRTGGAKTAGDVAVVDAP